MSPLSLSVSPHIHSGNSTREIMQDVLLALMPAAVLAVVFFGLPAFVVMAAAVIASVLTEYLLQKILKRPVAIGDYSAVVTGLLLAFCLPPATAWWAAALGAVVSIAIAKQLFGGIGFNVFNPALIGRAFLLASYPVMITTWTKPFDTITTATPLALNKAGLLTELAALWSMFVGNIGGSLGETSALALLLGAGYLFFRRVIDWRIPAAYLATVAGFMYLVGQNVGFQLLAGGLILGAFFMATDYATSPMKTKGKIIFGIGCGVLTTVIRIWGGYPEGVCYAILIMNMFVPLIDRIK
jgi:Na+-translocating ferredoxin:NAD+ oxidoreductase subunit D